jgi:hypothetical protein
MFLFLGPFNYVADLIWLSGDPQRQALRDKFTQTYVVRKKAVREFRCAGADRFSTVMSSVKLAVTVDADTHLALSKP